MLRTRVFGNNPPGTSTPWARVALIYGCGLVAAGQLGLVPPLVPALQRDLGITLTTAGLAISIVTLVGAVLGLAAGSWAERIGHNRALAAGLLVMALAASLCGLSGDGLALLGARALAGIGYLLVVVAAPSLMAHAAIRRDQPFALAIWGTFVPAGIAVAQALAGAFGGHVGWRGTFWADTAMLALVMVAAYRLIPSSDNTSGDERLPRVWDDPAALFLSIAFCCFAMVFLALAGLLPVYLVERRGLAGTDAAQVVALATGAGILGSLIAGWRMRCGAPGPLAATGLLGSSAATLLVFTPAVPDGFAVAGAVAAFVIGGAVPAAVFASVPQLARQPAAIGPINGMIAQLGSLGSLLGPPLLAAWVGALGWQAAPILLLGVAVAGAWCLRRVALPARS